MAGRTSFFLLVLAVISLDISQCKGPEVPKSTRLNSLVMIHLIRVMGQLRKCAILLHQASLLMDGKQIQVIIFSYSSSCYTVSKYSFLTLSPYVPHTHTKEKPFHNQPKHSFLLKTHVQRT